MVFFVIGYKPYKELRILIILKYNTHMIYFIIITMYSNNTQIKHTYDIFCVRIMYSNSTQIKHTYDILCDRAYVF